MLLIALLVLTHFGVERATRMRPPPLDHAAQSTLPLRDEGGTRQVRGGYARHRGGILEVTLFGNPEQLGVRQMSLLRPELLQIEQNLWNQLDRFVPISGARLLLFDMARWRYRDLDRRIDERYLREIAANAQAFAPDPFADRVPTFQRMVFLHALYDIALSFEGSPLVGCTSFVLPGERVRDGHVLLARNFDFEAGDIFDREKALFYVHEEGRLAYASVSWPGLLGAVTGINAAGLSLVVHGARAGIPSAEGEPLLHSMREVLARAHDVEEAVAILRDRKPMISHMVLLADKQGNTAVVERVPYEPLHVRRSREGAALTNHLEGPLSGDPKNRKVVAETSTLQRRARLEERLRELPWRATVADAIDILRDRRAVGGGALSPGDRGAIDAQIATHAVVMDLTEGVVWLSEGPHLQGRFLRFDVGGSLGKTEEQMALPPGEQELVEFLP